MIVNNRARPATGSGSVTPSDSPSSPSKPPALPSRLNKPITSPLSSPQKSVAPKPVVNGNTPAVRSIRSPTVKAVAPPPPPLSSSSSSPPTSHYAVPNLVKTTNGSPVKLSNGGSDYQAPIASRLPRPMISPPGSRGQQSAPLSTSSPKLGSRPNGTIVGNNVISLNVKSGSDHESPSTWTANNDALLQRKPKAVVVIEQDSGSLDSGSFEQDSLDASVDFDLAVLINQSELAVNRVISRLALPIPAADSIQTTDPDEELVTAETVRERLISESRQFVTASKMFVKSVTDSPQNMAICMSQCVALVERMGEAVEDVAQREQNRDLPCKVRDVARAFLHTLRAASEASGQGVSDPSMGRLMGKATALAGVLTILMRSLRP